MKIYRLLPLLSLIAVLSPVTVQSEQLTTAQLIESIKRNHPKLMALNAAEQQVSQGIQAAEGAFDMRVEQNTRLKTSGYYDGKHLSQSIIKPLRFMGGELKSEYRISDGNFADYDGELDTRSGGEASIGLALPLMRDREIDKRRVAVNNAKLGVQEWNAQAQWSINQLLYSGLSSYLDWYETHLRLIVMRELYKNTQIREQAINTRVKKGDIAAISVTEFNAITLNRLSALQEARQQFARAQQALTFYYRDDKGEMTEIDKLSHVPQNISWPYKLTQEQIEQIEHALNSHPSLSAIAFSLEQAKNEYRLSENALLPKLDIKAKVARDIGSGSETLGMVDSEIGLQFSVPLGQQTAKAEKVMAQQKVRELEYELKLRKDSLVRDFRESVLMLENIKQIAEIQARQAQTANALFLQEQKRFDVGVSDLFLLNARETSAIEAKLKAIEADVAILRQELTTLFIAAKLDTTLTNP